MSNVTTQADIEVLGRWALAVVVLAREAPPRLSATQLALFALAALHHLRGRPATMRDLRAILGPAGRCSVQTTYAIFLKPSSEYPERLGWLENVRSPIDGREKFLLLTPRGKTLVGKMLDAMSRL